MSTRKVAVMAVAAVVLMGGCGSNESSGSTVITAADTTVPTSAETTSGTSPESSPSSTEAPPSTDGIADIGQTLVAAFEAIADGRCSDAEAITTAFDNLSTPGESAFFAALGQLARAFSTLSSSGPEELRGDFATMSKAFGAASDAFEAAGITDGDSWAAALSDPAQLAQLSTATEGLGGAAFEAASGNIEQWLDGKCPGLTTSTG